MILKLMLVVFTLAFIFSNSSYSSLNLMAYQQQKARSFKDLRNQSRMQQWKNQQMWDNLGKNSNRMCIAHDEQSIVIETTDGSPAKQLYDQIKIKFHPKMKGLEYKVSYPQVLRAALYYEARSEGERGIRAVASVIYNRHLKGRYKGMSYADICTEPKQFSCFNDDNKPMTYCIVIKSMEDVKALNIIDRVVEEMRSGRFNPIISSTHYVTIDFYNRMEIKNPNHWCRKMILTYKINRHIFGQFPNEK